MTNKVQRWRHNPLEHLVDHFLLVFIQSLPDSVQVCIFKWTPAELSWLHVNHTTTGYSGRGSLLQVCRFEHHVHHWGHLNNFTGHETKFLVVVKYSVHVLNPNLFHKKISSNVK